MRNAETLKARIRRIEARQEIEDLAVRYGLAVDDRDFEAIKGLFAPNGRLRTRKGVSKGDSVESVVSYFVDHMPNLGPTNHFIHGHLIDFDDHNDGLATGIVSSHAELWRQGRAWITAMRYLDTYTDVRGSWRFLERIQSYMYFLDVQQYSEALGASLPVRGSDHAEPSDWPDISA